MSRMSDVQAFALVALASVSLPSCTEYHGEKYGGTVSTETLSSQVDRRNWSSYSADDSRYTSLIPALIKLDNVAIEFANNLVPLLTGEELILDEDKSALIGNLRESLISTENQIHQLLKNSPSEREEVLFLDFVEQVGETRGALFGALSPHGSYVFFPGDGINEVHGLIAKNRALIEMFGSSK